jgi:hypothetical protein
VKTCLLLALEVRAALQVTGHAHGHHSLIRNVTTRCLHQRDRCLFRADLQPPYLATAADVLSVGDIRQSSWAFVLALDSALVELDPSVAFRAVRAACALRCPSRPAARTARGVGGIVNILQVKRLPTVAQGRIADLQSEVESGIRGGDRTY